MSHWPEKKEAGKIDAVPVWYVPNEDAFFFKAKMAVEADGAPNAYAPKDRKDLQPLEPLANAGPEGNWWAIAYDKKTKKPYIQDADKGHPCPGYYVSTTSMVRPGKKDDDPARYVDATRIQYIAMPYHTIRGFDSLPVKPKYGDVAVVLNALNDKLAYAVWIEHKNGIGEGSVALAKAIGVPDSPRTGGTKKKDIVYLVFAGANMGFPTSQETVDKKAKEAFDQWGGIDRLKHYFS